MHVSIIQHKRENMPSLFTILKFVSQKSAQKRFENEQQLKNFSSFFCVVVMRIWRYRK